MKSDPQAAAAAALFEESGEIRGVGNRRAAVPSPPAAQRAAAASTAVRLLGSVLLLLLSLLIASATVPYEADPYDEGLIANGAALTLRGQLPGASFYTPYPPGAFGALAFAFRLCGVRLIVERWFAAVLAALVAASGFWLVSGLRSTLKQEVWRNLRTTWLASLAVTLLLSSRWVTPVNGGALLLVFISGLALYHALPGGHPAGAFQAGALVGATALWRLDFGLYAFMAGLLIWLLLAGRSENTGNGGQRAAGGAALVLGTLAVSVPPLLWILQRGGQRAANALFWWPITSTGAARLPWTKHWSAFLVPFIAVLLLIRAAPALRQDRRRGGLALWLLVIGIGFLAYALGRTHATHLLPLRVVSLLLVAVCIDTGGDIVGPRSTAPPISRHPGHGHSRPEAIGFLILFAATAVGPIREYFHARQRAVGRTVSLPGPRGEGVFPPQREVVDYERILTYLNHQVSPDAWLFCGAPRHDMFLKDDNLAYFLSDHKPGTYYWCLDAGVTSTEPVQEEIVHELEESRVEVVLIRTASVNREKNAGSHSSGVHRLDNYLRTHFRLAEAWDDYQIYRREPRYSQPR